MYRYYFKRVFDAIISLIGLPFLLLLIIILAIIIKFEDRGPVFHTSFRLGKNGIPFKIFKFRSMIVNAPDLRLPDGSTFNDKNDSRVTKIGKFLRESSLDEFPQLLNVLMGQMSIIGPRPDLNSNDKFPEESKLILKVKPGITGYNQAYYRNETDWPEKIKNDLYYVENISFGFDMKILCKTVYMVIKRDKMYRKKTNSQIR